MHLMKARLGWTHDLHNKLTHDAVHELGNIL